MNRRQARRLARERALQALYQWDLGDDSSSEVYQQFLERQEMGKVDVSYFETLFKGVSHNVDATDESLIGALDRPLEDLDPIERAVLRVAVYELQHSLDIPARVIITEGVEITRRFGADKGHRYINGVLDKTARALRPIEMQPR